ncbi:MAG: hypothetical protein ACRDZ5_09625, partial [Acidimicrobiales bacterium]
MADESPFERYIAAGMAFSQITRERAGQMLRELVGEGEEGRDQAAEWFEEVIARSRRGAEQIAELVRTEVRHQIKTSGLVTVGDVAKMIDQVLAIARRRYERRSPAGEHEQEGPPRHRPPRPPSPKPTRKGPVTTRR